MLCPSCQRDGLFWSFSENKFSCLKCSNFVRFADVSLWASLGQFWSVIFAEGADAKKVYLLRKYEMYVGTLTDYLGGVVYFEGAKNDDEAEENLLAVSKSIFEAFGVSTLHDGRGVITYFS